MKDRREKREPDLRLDKLLRRFESVFRSELPDGLPPRKFLNHAVEVEKELEAPHCRLYQLSLVEQKAGKKYIETFLKKGNFRRSNLPYGAPLFFVKVKLKLRGVVDY